MEDDSCSRRSSRLRAYSRFYGAMVREQERVRDDSKVNLQKQSWSVQLWSNVSGSSAGRKESSVLGVLELYSGR